MIGYDSQPSVGGISRFYVTEEDVRHVPETTWNPETRDEYEVYKFVNLSSGINSWGVWIDHDFEVTGTTAPGDISGGNLDVDDFISATGWIDGTPSNASPTGNATYSGTDNFLGVDMGQDYLGALLRADANLRYYFTSNTMSLHLDNFEAHYSRGGPAAWHDHSFSDWGEFPLQPTL